MPNPFNFYRGTGFGTGIGQPSNISGHAVDYLTGFYFPIDLSLGKSVGFLWPASDTDIFNTLAVSGAPQSSNKDRTSLGAGFYAFMSPLLRESGNIFLKVVSGNALGSPLDTFTFQARIISFVSGDNIDRPILKLSFTSGDQISGSRDVTTNRFSYTGQIQSGDKDIVPMRLSFYGMFSVPDTDYAATRFRMDNILYDDTVSVNRLYGSTGAFLRFRFDTIIYDDAV